jgi:hypothetical protein
MTVFWRRPVVSSLEEAVILSHLKALKLFGARTEYVSLARHAQKDGWS